MSLSNTATPKYYGEFREAVRHGEIPICEEISQQMNRIDELIDNPNFYYDENAINGFVAYCENELTLTDGSDLHLLPAFKLWAEDLLSWFYFVERSVYEPNPDGHGGKMVRKVIKKRLVKKQYLIVARGSAKSMYAMCLQAYFLNVYPATTHQITTAPTMAQAEEVMSPFRTAITRARGPLFKFLTEGSLQNTTGSRALRQKLVPTKKGIENFFTNSLLEVRPMSKDKLQGLRPYCTTVDEWLSGDTREDIVGAIEQGASKDQGPMSSDEYVICAISSEGTVRNGPGDSIKIELKSVLKGEYWAPHISIWHYKLDDVKEVGMPERWLKANPNLGITVSYETYQQDVERAENAPATRNDILAKRFGLPMEGHSFFFKHEETEPHKPFREFVFDGMNCAMGADLSQGDDFCAFTFMFPLGGEQFGVKTRSYVSELTFMKLSPAARQKYDEFLEEGSLHVMDGTVLDLTDVYDDLEKHILTHQYNVNAFGYDPYNAAEFVKRWEKENGPFGIEKVIQGAKTESVPLGELKKLAEQRNLIFDEELMKYAMGNAITIEDTNGNRKLMKRRREDKIDNVAAMIDAYVAYKLNKEIFE